MDEEERAPIRRLHGVPEQPEGPDSEAPWRELWRAIQAMEPIACRACGGPIEVEQLEGVPLWRAAWPAVRCAKGCTLIEGAIHLNLWPDL